MLENGKKLFVMEYKLQGIVKVCRKTFASAFGFSIKKLERCSAALKQSPTLRVHKIEIKKFKDEHIHNYSYKETETLMKDNLNSDFIGIIINELNHTY